MSRDLQDRDALLEALANAGRRLSTATVLYHSAVAEHFGLNATDWKCAELLTQTGPIPAGELATLSGLTTGAITGVVDRLEQANFVRRERDPGDRRRVIIRPIIHEEHAGRTDVLMQGLRQGLAEVSAAYNPEELEAVLAYITQMTQVLRNEAMRLRKEEVNP